MWIVDPLDGTREFSEEGRTDWAVHVALWGRGADDLVAGAVALPAQGIVYGTAQRRPGAGREPTHRSASRPAAPGRRRSCTTLCERLGGVQVPMGSAGAKIAAVVSGEVDAYVHAGGQYEWDSAAPVAVALAAGLHTSRVDGSPLRLQPRRPAPARPHRLPARAGRPILSIAGLSRRREQRMTQYQVSHLDALGGGEGVCDAGGGGGV